MLISIYISRHIGTPAYDGRTWASLASFEPAPCRPVKGLLQLNLVAPHAFKPDLYLIAHTHTHTHTHTHARTHTPQTHRLTQTNLQEELVGYTHGPFFGNWEGFEHIRCIGTLDQDLHLELQGFVVQHAVEEQTHIHSPRPDADR